VHSVMLGGGNHFEVARIVALQAFDERDSHGACEEGILAVGLLSPSPAGIAEDVDVWRPEGQPEILFAFRTFGEPPLPSFVVEAGQFTRVAACVTKRMSLKAALPSSVSIKTEPASWCLPA
jgi:hypothetical protein